MISKYKVAASQSLIEFSNLVETDFHTFEQSLMQLHTKVEALQLMVETPDCMSQIINGVGSDVCLPTECIVTMTGLPPYIRNLYPCEFTPSNIPYRWTGPDKETTFFLWIDRSEERALTLEILSAIQPNVLDDLVISIDGQKTTYERLPEGIFVRLTEREGRSSLTEICLTVLQNYTPREVSGTNDNRPLGLALSRLLIK
jgi:hypothetical protein